MNKTILVLLVAPLLFFPHILHAGALSISGNDTIQSVLTANEGKRVIVRLASGKVGTSNGEVVHLIELSGREFFDAVVSIGKIEAVIIRTRQ